MFHRGIASFLLSALACAGAVAQDTANNLADMDLQSLMQMDIDVTTASKTSQSIYSVAAPIYVITAEDIRHAGATSLPEAIRLAPGVVVGQIGPGKWVVALRGFAWQYANKALILLDGRGVYTPLNSSVYWNTLDVPIDQIERIEVIRGPGDARWGSHAVNGIINIITQAAGDYHGSRASARLDSNGSTEMTFSHGAALAQNAAYGAYASYLDEGAFPSSIGLERLGDRTAFRAGVRVDAASRRGDQYTLMMDGQHGRDASAVSGQAGVPVRYDANEWSVVGRWERDAAARLNQQLQVSFDYLDQNFYEERHTLDVSYQARLAPWLAQTWTFGMTYKRSADELSAEIAISPDRMTLQTYGVFLHDSVALTDTTRLLVGAQLEHNDFTGWEAQPNLQLIYSPAERLSY